MVSMMPNDDRCFVCGWMGHFGYHCPSAQCYSCDEFGHFAQDCPNKIPLSGAPHHQDNSHSRPWYTHTQSNRSHSTHYGHRHGRHFSWSQSCWGSHLDQSSSRYRRHTLGSPSSYYSSSCHPLADGCPHCHSSHDTPSDIIVPLPDLPHLPPTSLLPLCHGPQQVLLQQPSMHCSGNTANEESQVKCKTFNPPYIPLFQDCDHPGLPITFFLRFRWLWIFKLLEPSPGND